MLWRLDLNACTEIARQSNNDKRISKEAVHLNCPAFSPDETRVAFVFASFTEKRRQHLHVAQWTQGKIVHCPLVNASHFCWVSDDEISVFGQDERGISGYWSWGLVCNELRPMGIAWPTFDGHQSPHPYDPDLWLTDSYPNRLGYQSLYVIKGKRRRRIADFYAPLGMAFDKCDLHPRWSPQGDMVIVDTAYSGFRRTLILGLN